MAIRIPLSLHHILPSLPPPSARNLWLLLSLLVAVQSCAVFYTSQSPNTSVLAFMIWGGSLICIEDQIDTLRPNPCWVGLIIGTFLLLWIFARTSIILHWDGILFILAPLAGIALTLLCLPPRNFIFFRDSLLCLLLLPSYALLTRVFPEAPLSLATAHGASVWLSILGLDVVVKDRHVFLPGGGVEVLAACNGLDMMSQLLCIGLIFMLAFRISSISSRFLLLISAPLIGFLCNTFRISLLTIFSASGHGKGSSLFTFFHEDTGSLVFSGLAVLLFGYLYMYLLERELPPIDKSTNDPD